MRTHINNLRGEQGGTIIADTNTHTPAVGSSYWAGFSVVQEAVIDEITMPGFDGSDSLSGLVLAEGTAILGLITSVKLISGVVQAMNHINPAKVYSR